MSEFEQLYREVILDHYKAPRNHGLLEPADVVAEGQNPLCEGEWDPDVCQVVCPRHGARFDLRTGNALTLPAYLPVATYPVRVREDGMIVIDVGDG